MNITIHIERLVLDGLPVTSHDAGVVQSAIEAELAGLFVQQGFGPGLPRGKALSHLRTGSIHVGCGASPAQIGDQVASVLHHGVVRASRRMPMRSERRAILAGGAE